MYSMYTRSMSIVLSVYLSYLIYEQLCTNSEFRHPKRHTNREISCGPHRSMVRYAAFFSTDQVNPHHRKRLYYRFPPYSVARCLRCGAVRCGAVRIFGGGSPRCGSTRCGPVLLNVKSLRFGKTAQNRIAPLKKKRTREKA